MNMPIVDIKEVEIEHKVYVFKDYFGNTSWVVCEHDNCIIKVYGLKNPVDQMFIQYTGRASNVIDWCRNNLISCAVSTKKFTLVI